MDASGAADVRRKILILEEDEYLASLLYFLLCREGFAISAFAEPKALQDYINSHAPASMIFVSHRWLRRDQSPNLDFLAKHPQWCATPVIMLMNYYDLDLVEHAAAMGVMDHLLQPFEPNQLLDMIQKYLDNPPPRTCIAIGKQPAM